MGSVEKNSKEQKGHNLLRSFARRTKLIFDIHEYNIRKEKPRHSKGFKVALVSTELRIGAAIQDVDRKKSQEVVFGELRKGAGEKPHLIRQKDELYTVFARNQRTITEREWIEHRLTELKEALDHNPDIICFPEFTYLPSTHAPHKLSTKIVKALREANKRPFVFMGSYHCPITYKNIGMILSPNFDDREDIQVDRNRQANFLFEEDQYFENVPNQKAGEPIQHDKKFPARRVGEETVVPVGTGFNLYKTEFANIAVLICSDILDLNQSLFIAHENLSSQNRKIDIVLVPAFNASSALQDFCGELSELANVLVVMNNVNPGNSGFPKTSIYFNGSIIEHKLSINDPDAPELHVKRVKENSHSSDRPITVCPSSFAIDLLEVSDDFKSTKDLLRRNHFLASTISDFQAGKTLGLSKRRTNL